GTLDVDRSWRVGGGPAPPIRGSSCAALSRVRLPDRPRLDRSCPGSCSDIVVGGHYEADARRSMLLRQSDLLHVVIVGRHHAASKWPYFVQKQWFRLSD